MLDEKTRSLMRELLPSRYYPEFIEEYQILFKVEKTQVPPRQQVYRTMKGLSDDIKIIQVLKLMCDKRKALKKELIESLEK